MNPDDTSQDGTLGALNSAARAWCEVLTRRRFVRQTWRIFLDFFPGYVDSKLVGQNIASPFVSGSNAVLVGIRYAIALPFPPVQSIDLFQYANANGSPTVMVAGTDFIQDLDSQPCRLTPLFGSMWPVARVIVEAIQIDYTVGYATPITLGTTASSGALLNASPPSFVFTSANVGQPISIPGAGPGGGTLNTVIASVSSGIATVRDTPQAAVASTTALLANHGSPGHWEIVKLGIKFLVNSWYVNRLPSFDPKTRDAIRAVLGPAMDLRV